MILSLILLNFGKTCGVTFLAWKSVGFPWPQVHRYFPWHGVQKYLVRWAEVKIFFFASGAKIHIFPWWPELQNSIEASCTYREKNTLSKESACPQNLEFVIFPIYKVGRAGAKYLNRVNFVTLRILRRFSRFKLDHGWYGQWKALLQTQCIWKQAHNQAGQKSHFFRNTLLCSPYQVNETA